MKRDMELVRGLLLKIESMNLPLGTTAFFNSADPTLHIDGFTPDDVAYNLDLLFDAGFIRGQRGMTDFGFSGLTWAGHDFLDVVRDPAIWAKTKQGALAAGGFTFDLLKELAKGFVKKQIEERTGVQL